MKTARWAAGIASGDGGEMTRISYLKPFLYLALAVVIVELSGPRITVAKNPTHRTSSAISSARAPSFAFTH
jgi:hypothetical protein